MTATEPLMSTRRRSAARALVLSLVYFLCAAFAIGEFLRWPGMDVSTDTRFGDMVYGRAVRPYVTRVLLPGAVRLAASVTPPEVQQGLARDILSIFTCARHPELLQSYRFELMVAIFLFYLCLMGFAVAFRRLAELTTGSRGLYLDIMPAVGLLLLPVFYSYVSHVYDFPALLFFTLGLVMIAERRNAGFFAVFLLATVNKETSLLLTFVWLLDAVGRMPRRRLVGLLVLQAVIWLAVRGGLLYAFRHNPGTPLLWTLPRNLILLSSPWSYLMLKSVGGWLLAPRGLNIVMLAVFAWTAWSARKASRLLRRSFLVLVPMVVLSLLFGYIDEIRVYLEFLPIGLAVLLDAAWRRLGYTPGDGTAPVPD